MAAVDTAATGHDRLRALWSLIEFTRPMMSSSILLFSSTGWQGRKKKKTHDTGRIKARGRESDREEKTENNRETGGGEESTSERISFPRGKRGERGMLSGTSAMSHMCSVKDASDKRRL